MLEEPDFGVLTAVMSFVNALARANPEPYLSLYPKVVNNLAKVTFLPLFDFKLTSFSLYRRHHISSIMRTSLDYHFEAVQPRLCLLSYTGSVAPNQTVEISSTVSTFNGSSNIVNFK
jgi:hypothetical protein